MVLGTPKKFRVECYHRKREDLAWSFRAVSILLEWCLVVLCGVVLDALHYCLYSLYGSVLQVFYVGWIEVVLHVEGPTSALQEVNLYPAKKLSHLCAPVFSYITESNGKSRSLKVLV